MNDKNIHRFTHEAMMTDFSLTIASGDKLYAEQAARSAFAELDRLESLLSRFREGSDVFILNHLQRGDIARINEETFKCLEQALQCHLWTRGCFEVVLPPQQQTDDESADTEAQRQSAFVLDRSSLAIQRQQMGGQIDLGGIGKGFALDGLAQLLKEWDLPSALLSSGGSTLLALQAPPGEAGWKVRLRGDACVVELTLAEEALAGSGTAVKGQHILDPRTGKKALANKIRAWARHPSAATADALSTAFYIMNNAEIRELLVQVPSTHAFIETPTAAQGSRIHEIT